MWFDLMLGVPAVLICVVMMGLEWRWHAEWKRQAKAEERAALLRRLRSDAIARWPPAA